MSTTGKIFLVGLGPGDVEHMTARARQAIAMSDAIIGYSTYIKLVADLIEGKQVIRKGMTEELDRCHEALALAREGKTVSLVSSGDSGVYGMAGPTYEVLFESGWHPGQDIEVEVVPGSSAINACAALVGAPLTHDACTISLSDLLTPWPLIAGRLDAAGRADFVVALYNPKSGRRTGQIVEAQRILLSHRRADTPVALIKSAYRRRQSIHLTTLDQMAECDIGMLTTVIIGNSTTFVRDGIMVTPRGYARKYEGLDSIREGEKAGRSLSMGLLGWHDYVRAFLASDSHITLEQAAVHFTMPLGAILPALAGEQALPWQSVALQSGQTDTALDFMLGLGTVEAVFQTDAGVNMRFNLKGFELLQNSASGQLQMHSDDVQMQIPWQKVSSAWFVLCNGQLRSLYFLDQQERSLLCLSLVTNTSNESAARAALVERFDCLEISTPDDVAEVDQNDE